VFLISKFQKIAGLYLDWIVGIFMKEQKDIVYLKVRFTTFKPICVAGYDED